MTTSNTGHGALAGLLAALQKLPSGSYVAPGFDAHNTLRILQAALSSASSGAGVLTAERDEARAACIELAHKVSALEARAILAATQRAEPVAQSGVEGRFALLRALADEVRASGRPMIADELEAIAALNAAPPAAVLPCDDCHGTGDVRSFVDGRCIGPCHCEAARPAPAAEAEPAAVIECAMKMVEAAVAEDRPAARRSWLTSLRAYLEKHYTRPAAPLSEVERLRAEQAAAVMPLIGPLLDAWESADSEFRHECPELHKHLRAIHGAMEGREPSPSPQPTDEATDAGRYRMLRRGQHWSVIDGNGNTLRGDDLDAAVDARLATPPDNAAGREGVK